MGNSFIVKQSSSGGGGGTTSSGMPYMAMPVYVDSLRIDLDVLKTLLESKGVDTSLIGEYSLVFQDKYAAVKGYYDNAIFYGMGGTFTFAAYGLLEDRVYNPVQTDWFQNFEGKVTLYTSQGYGPLVLVIPLEWSIGIGSYDNPHHWFVKFTEEEINSFIYV